MSRNVRVALVQDTATGSAEEVLAKSIDKLREAAANKAQICCLKELFSSPYFCTKEEESHFDLAEDISSETFAKLAEVAKENRLVIIVPFFERRAAGVYHNSAAVIDADGSILGVYRKMHIPDDPLYYEKYYFTPGDSDEVNSGYRIFDTAYGRIGVLICWDQWYPEAARITSLLGAEILFYPTAIGWHPSEKEECGEQQWEAWHTVQRSHAIANGLYVAAVNRVGHEKTEGSDGIEFYGRSFVCAPNGEVIGQARTGEEELLCVDCDLSLIETHRRQWPFFRDRRIDSYSSITKRFIDDE
ncbi:UNVERIFIED_CONTAM: hypothetical protein GTU68_046858 [Idotea baltica]|nr:hypothetical protein [Idotea baltica]